MIKKKPLWSYIYIAMVMLFIYLPIVSLVIFSFNEPSGRHGSLVNWNQFGFSNYTELFQDRNILNAVGVTINIAVLSTIASTMIGTFAAIGLARMKRKFRDTILSINNIPVVTPEIITALALFVLFMSMGLRPGFVPLLLAHISFSVPFVLITVYPKVRSLDPNLVDASNDLGAKPLQTLFKVILPQLKGAMIAGAAIAFTMSFDDFIISYFVGGTSQNISAYIYSQKGTPKPTINALSTMILFVVLAKGIFDYIKSKKQNKKEI